MMISLHFPFNGYRNIDGKHLFEFIGGGNVFGRMMEMNAKLHMKLFEFDCVSITRITVLTAPKKNCLSSINVNGFY